MPKKLPKINEMMEFAPGRYNRPAESYLTVLMPGGGSKIYPVKEISAEEIELPDKTRLYTGVAPQLTHHKFSRRWKTARMHYTRFGWPFTIDPLSQQIFNNERKRQILIKRGAGIPIWIGDRQIVVLVDPETQGTRTPRPIWQLEELGDDDLAVLFPDKVDAKGKFDKTKLEKIPETQEIDWNKVSLTLNFANLERWIAQNIENLGQMETIELPVATEYDVSEPEMMRAETFQLLESGAIEKGFASMEKLGEDTNMFWWYVVGMGFLFATFILFMYAGSEGVFAFTLNGVFQ